MYKVEFCLLCVDYYMRANQIKMYVSNNETLVKIDTH